MNMQRREFLKTGGLAGGALGLNLLGSLGLPNNLFADGHSSNKKMLFIFQRGGNDGINAVIPRGDNEYNTTNRPTLFLRENQALDLGNGFAQLHPGLEPMMEIFNNQKLNGQDGPGNLAVIHRVGYAGQSRSHFNSQHYWENATPGRQETRRGDVLPADHRDAGPHRRGKRLCGGKPVRVTDGFSTRPQAIAEFPKGVGFCLQGQHGAEPQIPGHTSGGGPSLADWIWCAWPLRRAPNLPRKRYRETVHRTGQLLGSTIQTLQDATRQTYTPANNATYPGGGYGERLKEAAMLFKRTNAKILGMNIGGWDTHVGQGQLYGKHRDLLGNVAMAFQAFYRDMQDQWDDMVVVTMTEFGRTSKENGSRGTDHAEATAMFVAGGGVKGGVYNCDKNTWKNGDMFSTNNERYLSRKTDFRSVFGEIFTDHFGNTKKQLAQVIPTYEAARGKTRKTSKNLSDCLSKRLLKYQSA